MGNQLQLDVRTVMTGEILTRSDGEHIVVSEDSVILIRNIDGRQDSADAFSPEHALAAARALTAAATKLINAEIGDDGKPTGPAHRFRRVMGS